VNIHDGVSILLVQPLIGPIPIGPKAVQEE